jgi:hypothetical protein
MPQVPKFYSDDCASDDDESIETLLSWDMPGRRAQRNRHPRPRKRRYGEKKA